jgi:phage-related protein
LGTAHGKIVLDYDSDKAVGRAEKDIDKLERKAKESDGTFKKLGKTLSTFATGAKLGGIGAAIGIAATQAAALGIQLLGIIPSLVSILSLSSALPAAFVGLLGTVGVLRAAFAGVGDAVKAAFDTKHPEKFQESLKNLAPAAAQFVTALHTAAPALRAFQQEIQQAFFQSSFLTGQIPRMMKVLAVLRPVLLGLAGDFGEATRRVANFALSADSVTFFNNALKATRAAFSEVLPSIVPVLAGLRAVGGVGLPLMVRLGEAIGKVAGQFGAWLQQIAASGQLQTWINTAIATLQTLGGIVKNIGSILFSVISAAQATGGGLLNTIQLITGQFATFLKSAEGSAAISSLFSGILEVAKQLAPILVTVVKVLASGLGPALATIGQTLGPVLLDVVNRLAPAIAPLAAALAALLGAIAPLLPPIAQLVALLAGVLSTAIQGLVAELGPLIEVIGTTLTQAFAAFMPVIGEMAKGLPVAAKAGIALAQAFAPLAPVIVKLASVIADSLVKAMPSLIAAAEKLIPVVVQFADALSTQLIDSLNRLIPLIPVLIDGFVKVLPIMLQLMTIGLRLATIFLQMGTAVNNAAANFVKLGVQLVTSIVGPIQSAYNAVVSAGGAIINWFAALPGRIMAFLNALPGMLKQLFINALNGVATSIGFGAGLIVGIFTKLPGDILRAVVTLGPILLSWMQSVWDGVRSRVVNGANATINFLQNFPRRAYNAVVSLIGLLRSIASSAWNGLVSRFNAGVSAAVNAAHNLPGRIRSALGNLGSLLVNSGVNVINGFINGIERGVGRVLDLVRGLADRVRNAFNSALGIFSPSKVFKASGKFVVEGLIVGIKGSLDAASRAAQALANTVVAPTVALPSQSGSAAAQAVQAAASSASRTAQNTSTTRQFGPYNINVGNQTIAQLMVDAITGNPIIVAKSANEGDRQNEFAGSGRR